MQGYFSSQPGWLINDSARRYGSDVLVRRILDEATKSQPVIDLFDPRKSDLLQVPSARGLLFSMSGPQAREPDELIQRILDNAAISRPMGLYDCRAYFVASISE
jgi:hypothetical protein